MNFGIRRLAVFCAAAVLCARAAAAPLGAARFWGEAVYEAARRAQLEPAAGQGPSNVAQTLARLRLELELRPQSSDALAFVARLPVQASSPELWETFPPLRRQQLIERAVAGESEHLEREAESLLRRTENRSGSGWLPLEDRLALHRLLSRWFYLAPVTARALKDFDAGRREQATLALAEGIAERLSRQRALERRRIVRFEIDETFAAASRLAASASEAGRSDIVEERLAPFIARSLDQAELRARERGVPPGAVYRKVIAAHVNLFGRLARTPLFRALGARQWSEFVAAACLHAASRLAEAGLESDLLAEAGELDEFRLEIPRWHRLSASGAVSVAHWLSRGRPPSQDDSGVLLLTLFGVPVRAAASLPLGLLTFSVAAAICMPLFSKLAAIHAGGSAAAWLAAVSPRVDPATALLLALPAAALLYLSLLVHELAHALTAKAFGFRTRVITLTAVGAYAYIVRGFRRACSELAIMLAGPLASALLGALLLALAGGLPPALAAALEFVGCIHLSNAALNALPLFPLDGGRAFRAALTWPFGSFRATLIAQTTTLALSSAAVGYGLWLVWSGVWVGAACVLLGLGFIAAQAFPAHPGTVTIDERAAIGWMQAGDAQAG
ncbi:MAG: M50 family metallopeptidase [Elusimicrobia bacterium]|nr:M50 family metallopeptidase [Elusimicrobiota bacterium]